MIQRIIGISLLVICSLIHTQTANGQWYNPDKVSKKAGTVYGHAYEAAEAGNYPEAIRLLDEALKLDPKFVDVYLSRAGIHAEMKNYTASVSDFEKGFALDSVYASTYLLPYSISLAGVGSFEKALEKVNMFLQTPNLNTQSIQAGMYRKSVFEFAVDQAKKNKGNYVFTPLNMGDAINSDALEYFPSFTIDVGHLIFTRRLNNDEDFYESLYQDGSWTEAKPVTGKINTQFNEGAQTISQDGNWLIFTGCNYPEGEGSCDLYIAYKTKDNKWTEPMNMGRNINTEFWESSPTLSPDKKDLYFSANRPGGYGGKDLWVSSRDERGNWSAPKNLGPEINTSGDEGCPFIHADNQTLYFNSNGHLGYGMTDLFLARKDSLGKWTKPVNLGYPINTIDDEGSLIVAPDGKLSIYAGDGADTRGGLDLYSFQLREDLQPLKTHWVKGTVYDANSKEGLPSSIVLTDINTRNIISKIQTDESGNYLITLPVGKSYAFNVNRKGYLFYSENFALTDSQDLAAHIIDIPLQSLEKGASIILKNIFFETKQSELSPASTTELDQLIQLMKENPNLRIQITGYTDNVGQDADNLQLSKNRAASVVNYLITNGIDKKRLQLEGLGEARPIADNETETGRALNRRTELQVLSN